MEMNAPRLAAVAFTVLGVYFIVDAAIGVPFVALYGMPWTGDSDTSGLFPVYWWAYRLAAPLASALQILLGAALIKWRFTLAVRLFPSELQEVRTSTGEFQSVALSVLGAYFVVLGLVGLGFDLFEELGRSRGEMESLFRNVPQRFIRPAIQVTVGLVLFLGTQGATRIWGGLRRAR
jgi:hypothetical protein